MDQAFGIEQYQIVNCYFLGSVMIEYLTIRCNSMKLPHKPLIVVHLSIV
jgi:hypothetical protein